MVWLLLDGPVMNMTEDVFSTRLTQYLYSPHGSQFRSILLVNKLFLASNSIIILYLEPFVVKSLQVYIQNGPPWMFLIYRFLFTFDSAIECGKPAPTIQLGMMDFQHRLMDGPKEQIPAMNRVWKGSIALLLLRFLTFVRKT